MSRKRDRAGLFFAKSVHGDLHPCNMLHNWVSGFSAGLDYSWPKTRDHQLQA